MVHACDVISASISILFYLASAALVIAALCTEHWVYATIGNDRDLPDGNSHVSAGIFSGVREIDWGLGSKVAPFTVRDEIQHGVSFYSRIGWIFLLFFSFVGLFWMVIGIIACFLSIVMKSESVAGILGIYIWSVLSSLCLIAVCLLFYVQYRSHICNNMLLAEQLQGGFTTEDRASIDYSFYLMLTAVFLVYIPPAIVFSSRTKRKDDFKEAVFDPTALLY